MMNYKIIIILYSLIFSLTAECKEYLYQWNYENQPYNVHINIQDSDVQDCIKKVDQWQKEAGTFSKGSRNYLRYLRYYPCGSYAAEIAEQLMLIGKENDFDRYQMGNFVTAFVNSFPYILDKDHQKINHYAQTPFETLIYKKGDCEDHAVMLAYFFSLFCYDTVMIVTNNADSYHLALGVAEDSVNDQYWMSRKFTYNNKKYLYCEATPCADGPCNSKIGECSPSMAKMEIIEYFDVPLNCKFKY